MPDYKQIATDARKRVLELIYKAQTSHIGSNFSCIDILAVLFEKMDLNKDVFVLSAGWKAASLYYFLWKKGKITKEELDSYCQEESKFIGLAEPIIPEIPIAGGSMGLGLPGAIGLALAKKLKKEEGTVYVLMSDGELQCGTTWESVLIAGQYELDNLIVLIDNNELQAMGKISNIIKLFPIEKKWSSFNWYVKERSGHNYQDVEYGLAANPVFGRIPHVIIFNTIKGKGVSFMENNNLYHYKAPSQEEYERAMQELNV